MNDCVTSRWSEGKKKKKKNILLTCIKLNIINVLNVFQKPPRAGW